MKSYVHLEDVSTTDVLQIIVRSESKKRLNVFHSMNMKIEDQGKTHYRENPCKFFFFLDRHQMIQQKRVWWSISLSMQQNNWNIQNMTLNMLVLKDLDPEDCNALSLTVVNCWIRLSPSGTFGILKLHLLVLNVCRDTVCERLRLIWMLSGDMDECV